MSRLLAVIRRNTHYKESLADYITTRILSMAAINGFLEEVIRAGA